MKIAISAGHYPERPGACHHDFCEHGEAMRWAELIAENLEGATLIAPGYLNTKVATINSQNFDIAVEIHFNSAKDAEGNHVGEGSETLFYPHSEKGAYVASEVQTSIVNAGFRNRGIKPGYYRMNKKNGPDFFLAKTNCPAIILEPEFIHYKSRIQRLRVETCQLIAEALKNLKV